MPMMDGCTLANELQAENPELAGAADLRLLRKRAGGSNGRFPLLPKPFSMPSLLLARARFAEQPVGRTSGYEKLQLISAGAGR